MSAPNSVCRTLLIGLALAACARGGAGPEPVTPPLDDAQAGQFATLALRCVGREYPNKVALVMASDADAKPPRELTPAFYGCFDWHSAVHGHWMLARLARMHPEAEFDVSARAALERSLTPSNIAREVEFVGRDDRRGFERPYGLVWLLQLGAELRGWEDADAQRFAAALRPLELVARERLSTWIPKLSFPIRSGEHSQTAFAFGLALDWARIANDTAFESLLVDASVRLYGADKDCHLAFEPSGHDFLSPCLASADLMRRVVDPAKFATWLDTALPSIPIAQRSTTRSRQWLRPVTPDDRTDGKLAHLDGLNLSRAWMLDGIAAALPTADPRRAALMAAGRAHAEAGLAAVTDEHYAGAHWLASFATYLTTRRGV